MRSQPARRGVQILVREKFGMWVREKNGIWVREKKKIMLREKSAAQK